VFPNERASAAAGENALGFRGPTYFSRTTNGGVSWEPARMIYDPGQVNQTIANQIVVLPDGTLVNVFDLIYNFKNTNKVRGHNVAVMRSTDKGGTWSKPTIVSKLEQVQVTDPDTGQLVRTGDIIPDVAVDRQSGALYIVWQDARFSSGHHDGIAFSKSTDSGRTWSAPVQINQVPSVAAFTATVHVADDGTIGVSYYDFRRNTTSQPLETDYWLVHSHDGGATWSENHIAGPFDMKWAPDSPGRGFFVGDYEGLTAVGNSFVPFFVQANSGNAANPSDVYITRVGQ
jgi:Neuraminidase (sialidase)